jgi:hypothetical protein
MPAPYERRGRVAKQPKGLKASTPSKVLAEAVLAGRGREVSGSWQTQQGEAKRGQAHTDFGHRVMKVPASDTPLGKLIRAHELAHLAVSPESDEQLEALNAYLKANNIPSRAYEVAEEFRVNQVIAHMDYDLANLTDGSEKASAIELASRGDVEAYNEAIAFSVAIFGTKASAPFITAIGKIQPDWREALKALKKELASEARSSWSGHWTNRDHKVISLAGSSSPGEVSLEYGHYRTAQIAEMIGHYLIKPSSEAEAGLQVGIGKADEYGHASGKYAPLIFDEVRPSQPVRGASANKRRVARDTGRRVAYPQRAITDPHRRMFAGKVTAKGGVVLIDLSGSMNLEAEHIEQLLEALPMATIIGYTHRPHSVDTPNAFLIASEGLVVKPEEIGRANNIGNGCDLPALRHAIGIATGLVKAGDTRANHRASTARTVQPLVWVFDGQATDSGDYPVSDEQAKQLAGLVMRHGVIIVPSVGQAIDALRAPSLTKAEAWGRVGRQLPKRYGGRRDEA